MKVLALDLGTKTGVAWNVGETYQWDEWDLAPRRHESPGMRFVKFRQSVKDALDSIDPGMVAYEEVARHAATHAAHIYGGLVAILQQVLTEEHPEIQYIGIPVGTIKKHATGKGNANKEKMIEAAAAMIEHQIPGFLESSLTDNQADALHLLDYTLTTYPG